MVCSLKEKTIPALLKQVKEMKFKSHKDLLLAKKISMIAFEKLKIQCKASPISSELNKKRCAIKTAEAEIIIGIVGLLNEKMMNFILRALDR